jgi:hypothetical protein
MDYYILQSEIEMSQRKLEGYLKLAEIAQWGRQYPTRFCERFYGIEFLDNQKYVFMMSWVTPYNVWCQSRNSGKTTLIAPFTMAKSNLVPNYQTYIISGIASQAQETFLKIEKIAKKEISSFTGLTDVFFNETVKSSANRDGFTHNPASFKYQLFNGSSTFSLNGNIDGVRGKRASCIIFDESGFIPDDLFTSTMPFITQDSNFKLGGNIDLSLLPKEFPNQAIMASSASSTDTYFWERYKEYSKKMIIGDKRYFCADINAEIVLNPTYNGKLYPALLRKEVIDDAMKDNKEKALREYYNKFSTEGGENQAIKRSIIIRNSEVRLPILANNSNKKFAIAYDPARSFDNAISMVAEIYLDKDIGYKMRICNGISFVDVAKKKKTPMRTPEQVEFVKQSLLDYNGKNVADYENVEALLIDAGAGGGGHIIADYFMEDWKDNKGIIHKGLIDKIECIDYISKFPNAVNKLKLMNPKKYKVEMYDALVEMLGLDLISFTDEYDMKGFLNIFENSELEYEDEKNNKKKEAQLTPKMHKLSFDEELALKNIDLSKEELVNIFRYDSKSGGRQYDLSPDKKSKMHDDRAYCLAMLAWYLQQKRRENITNTKKKDTDWLSYCMY